MSRALLTILPVIAFAGAAAYVLGAFPAAETPESQSARTAEAVFGAGKAEETIAAPAPAQDTAPGREERSARNVTPPGVHWGPVRRDIPAPPSPPAAEETADIRRYHRVVVSEPGALKAGKTTVRLTGIEAPSVDETCTDSTGRTWPCGRAAVGALRKLVGNRAVDCEIVSETEVEIEADCAVGQRGLSEWLVAQGWAEPSGNGHFAEVAEAARTGQRGMFTAAWRSGGEPVAIPEPFRTGSSDRIVAPLAVSAPDTAGRE